MWVVSMSASTRGSTAKFIPMPAIHAVSSSGEEGRRERSLEHYFVLCRCEQQRSCSVSITRGYSLLLTR